MHLLDGAAHAWPVSPHNDEQVLCYESNLLIFLHDFDMRESLAVGTYLVLALYYDHAAFAQNPERLLTCLYI